MACATARCLWLGAALLLLAGRTQADDCAPEVARLVSIQGTVEFRRGHAGPWSTAPSGTVLCPGDSVRVAERGRAALRLVNQTNLRLDQNTTLELTSTKEQHSFIELLRGALNVSTRTPKPFTVRTPFVNAGVEGTEFLVRVDGDAAQILVFEGRVSASNDRGRLDLVRAESALAPRDGPPRRGIVVRPVDAVEWALYYPSVTVPVASERSELHEAELLMRSGRTSEAFGKLERVPPADRSLRYHVFRAELLLRVGRIDEADVAIARAIEADAHAAEPQALRAVVALVKNDVPEALRLAGRAVELDPASASAQLAMSYAEQGRFDLPAALAAAQRATALAPDSALAWARAAELRLAGGEFDAALAAARRAAAAGTEVSRAQSILGFAHLVRADTQAAAQAFARAIELDQADYLPRLGRGMARIRDGALAPGREEIEIAAALDPFNSLVRSYLGKAYHDELRDGLAAGQFELAKALDPNDPTPWFYDAVRLQSQYRPADALAGLQKSIELNGQRAVYRSKLMVDEDLAARNARLARTYADLGFDQLVLAEAYRSLALDPQDFASHRILADAFSGRPRHDTARVSEMLQAQLWQPLNVAPVETQRLDEQPRYLAGEGPASPSAHEFDALFVRQGGQAHVSALAGGHGTRGDQLLVAGLFGKTSVSLGQFHYETDGFQDGWGSEKDVYSALLQQQLGPDATAFVEARQVKRAFGDQSQNFFGPPLSLRLRWERDLVRVGLRGSFAPGFGFAAVVTRQDLADRTELPVGNTLFSNDAREQLWELLLPYRGRHVQMLAGVGRYRAPSRLSLVGFGTQDSVGRSDNAYLYSQIEAVPEVLNLQLGLSRDTVEVVDLPARQARTNPKFGLVYRPWASTVLRLAAFRTLRRNLLAEQTVEPTQVAGFNQFFDDSIATRARRVGVGVDQRLSSVAFVGVEASHRRLLIPQSFTGPIEQFTWTERDVRAYAYWLPNPKMSAWVEYGLERLSADPLFAGGFLHVKTHRLPIGVKWFRLDQGLSVRVAATGVRQTGLFRTDPFSDEFAPGASSFCLVDIAVARGFPQRRGQLSLEVRNVFDRRFSFQETDIFTPTLARGRVALVRLSLLF